MRPQLMALALLTLCSLPASGCGPTVVFAPVKPPAERMDCVDVSGRPSLPPEYVIDWTAVTTVQQARSEHEAFVRVIRTREGIVAGHLVATEGKLFACSTDAAWLRDFFADLPDPE
jgi:hypothetical protein